MIEMLLRLGKLLLCLLPFILFALLNMAANLKKEYRDRQFLMPIITLLYSIVLIFFLDEISSLLLTLIYLIPDWLAQAAAHVSTWFDGALTALGNGIDKLGILLEGLLQTVNITYLLLFALNALLMLAHVIVKKIIVTLLKRIFRNDGRLHDFCVKPFYEKDNESNLWYIREHFSQARTYLKTFYFATLIISSVIVLLSCELYREGLLAVPFYPVFGVMIVGEIYFFLNGLNRSEMAGMLSGEEDMASSVSNYVLLRQTLVKLFGDKLGADNTTIDNGLVNARTNDELLHELEQDDDMMLEAYGRFMRIKAERGLRLDHNYLASGEELLRGNSILFNNPFYYDLIPYIFYPMNRAMLRRKKVLIVLGRHDIEGDIEQWCREGLTAVTNVPSMWNIGVLSDKEQELDVGILTRSSVHDLALHEANNEFFREVDFVVIVEPSKLVTTAQIGLNSIVRHCRRDDKRVTFCSMDKNCDGLLDALSHILLTSLTEVSATNHHRGTSSYMCWETDGEHLQHRLLPNLSRYLGMGTELSFAALKNQVTETEWYGGDVFPVVDMHWIVKQYYYDLLHYADLPASQEAIDEHFKVSPNLWNVRVKKNHYLTVEDEAYNMFEVKREFATRAENQGFINIISPEYLLKDYMMDNNALFNADPKAIPYIVADYAPTPRNVILRLCLRMSTELVSESDIRRDLMLIDIAADNIPKSLWHEICVCCQAVGENITDKEGNEKLIINSGGAEAVFTIDTLRIKKKFSMETGKMENMYSITDAGFISLLLDDLQNAGYIAEDEKGDKQYLGTELRGHIFQKYLPGQFFTFGGKYYEMLRVTSSGQVLVRRAADHINGRPSYRQVRNYYLANAVDSATMGDSMDIAGLHIRKQYADIRVETPAYWRMDKYNDFKQGRRVAINAVPERIYRNKQVLRIDLPDAEGKLTPEICGTITLLFNEAFRTLFAENHAYIAAVMPGAATEPSTYSLSGENGFEPGENCIYIIEDSQLDLGLLVAVQRNLNRIFSIICDYLDWHIEALEASLNPPPEPEVPDYTIPQMTRWEKFKNGITKPFRKIAEFFRRLFKRKPKPEKKKKPVPQDEVGAIPAEPVQPEAVEPVQIAAEQPAAEAIEVTEAIPEEAVEAAEPAEAEQGGEAAEPMETEQGEEIAEPADSTEEASTADEEDNEDMPPLMLMNTNGSADEEKDTLAFEPIETKKDANNVTQRKPYHERYYLLYGGTQKPAHIDIEGTHDFLKALGFGKSSLKQAREGKGIAEMIEKNFTPEAAAGQHCDFCGVELVGTEYEVLADGRDRCMMCSKTAVKTEEEFRAVYKTVVRNMETFFGMKITAPVKVEMVNSKKLHKRLGRTFVPTGNYDGRVLGVAIKDKDGYSIMLENGSPRMQATMTIAHELIHIWQYLNWDRKAILRNYGKAQELEVYEGMAKWGEIQYAYLIGETAAAKREELLTLQRQDEYGFGLRKYLAIYPFSVDIQLKHRTPFTDKEKPL